MRPETTPEDIEKRHEAQQPDDDSTQTGDSATPPTEDAVSGSDGDAPTLPEGGEAEE